MVERQFLENGGSGNSAFGVENKAVGAVASAPAGVPRRVDRSVEQPLC